MDAQTATLLEKAFGQLGVVGKEALITLAAYYRVNAIAELVILCVFTAVVCVLIRGLLRDIEDEEESTYWSGLLVFKTSAISTAGGITLLFWLFGTSSLVSAIFSPEGYALSRLVSAVSK